MSSYPLTFTPNERAAIRAATRTFSRRWRAVFLRDDMGTKYACLGRPTREAGFLIGRDVAGALMLTDARDGRITEAGPFGSMADLLLAFLAPAGTEIDYKTSSWAA